MFPRNGGTIGRARHDLLAQFQVEEMFLFLKHATFHHPHRACLGGIGLLHYDVFHLGNASDVVHKPAIHRDKLGGVADFAE